MANKEALKELQGRLAERLQEVRSLEHVSGWLAVECAGQALLFPLAEAGEIFQASSLLAVPHTEPWFLGVANLRGALTGVVDLAGVLGLRDRVPAAVRDQAHLVAFNPGLEINVALLVDRLAGLRHPEQMRAVSPASTEAPAFAGGCWRDSAGRLWQEIRLSMLPREERFLRIVAVR
ncbi:MAG: twitching motility protein PilI [Pseudomonadota bacterium]|nr:twitching motility protein PilI [Pseudomonadota bacterium]